MTMTEKEKVALVAKEGGDMLLKMIAAVAVAAKIKPEEMARYFTVDKNKAEKWMTEFTMECIKLTLATITKTAKKK